MILGHWNYPKKTKVNINNYYGFVYAITDIATTEVYIGCKAFYSITNPKISKKRSNALYTGVGRKKKREQVIKESNWKSYTSSSNKVNSLIDKYGKSRYQFDILKLCKSKQEMLLNESYMIINKFLTNPKSCLNDWVSVKAFNPCIRTK